MENCFYCKLNDALDKEIINPFHKEVHPTCAVCEHENFLVEKDFKKFAPLKTFGKIFILSGLIFFFPYGWKTALLLFLVGFGSWLSFFIFCGNNADNRFRLKEQFAKEKGLKTISSTQPQ